MKKVSFCSSFKALSTDSSFIKIGVCYQKLSTLEFNFHYRLSSHCLVYTHTQPGSSGEGVMDRKPQKEEELFSGTQKHTKDKKQNQKEKDVPPTPPDATNVHRCQYGHSQQFTLVVITRHFAHAIATKDGSPQLQGLGPYHLLLLQQCRVTSFVYSKFQQGMNTHVTMHDCYLKVNQYYMNISRVHPIIYEYSQSSTLFGTNMQLQIEGNIA